MKILIFTEGTILRHTSRANTREDLVAESKADLDFILDYKNYQPIGDARNKIASWSSQGAEIFYLSSRKLDEEIQDIRNVLTRFGFPKTENLLFRSDRETYAQVAERLIPDILIEDDCESIGGSEEMTYTNIRSELKEKIKSIAVKEFGGIDFLPDDLSKLNKY